MSRVAEQLRRDTLAADLALSPVARLERALGLGEADAVLHAQARGIEVEAARLALRRGRAVGRRPSGCAAVR